MKTLALLFLLAPYAFAADPAGFDRDAFYRHVRKAFSAPATLKLELKDLKPSPLQGWLTGKLVIGEDGRQTQPVTLSEDGRFYVMSPAFRLGPSKLPGMRAPVADPEGPEPPALQVMGDGSFFLVGQPQDLRVDPDAANRAKMRYEGAGWGPADAPVTIVEYSDFQCPHCKRAFESLEKDVLPKYAGKVRVFFKHYPLTNIHPWAFEAAVAASCASRLSPAKTQDFYAALFSQQETIQKENFRAKVLELAKKNGLAESKFARCLDKQETKAALAADEAEATALGVSATPAIYVNGRRAPHYAPEVLGPLLDEMLAAPK
ncbi:MAG: DsbA family protein [Elusimicrobiota bacterium]|jgi:protein-disulfide isomerase